MPVSAAGVLLGEEKGMAFADVHDLPVLMILRANDGTFHERYNKNFAPYLGQHPGGRTDCRR